PMRPRRSPRRRPTMVTTRVSQDRGGPAPAGRTASDAAPLSECPIRPYARVGPGCTWSRSPYTARALSVAACRPKMRYHRSSDVTWEMADERAVILDAGGSTLTTLNPVGTLIWRYLELPRDTDEISRHLAGRFPRVDPRQLHDDAEAFIGRLADDGL